MKDKELTMIKLLGVGCACWYLYKSCQKQGISMSDLPDERKPNPVAIAGLVSDLLPQEYRKEIIGFGSQLLRKAIK